MIGHAIGCGRGIRGLVNYLLHGSKKPGEPQPKWYGEDGEAKGERVDWTLTENLPTENIDLAIRIMQGTKADAPVLKQLAGVSARGGNSYGDPVDELFTTLDKTDNVDARTEAFADAAQGFAAAVLAERAPEPVLNHACRNCDFFKTVCLGSSHAHTVLELPNLRNKLQMLSEIGVIDIADVPADFKLNQIQERVKTVAESGETFVSPGLGDALAAIEWPCHYLDFETVASTMPLYPGHGCHRQVLTQFSVHHRESLDAASRHSQFLADAARNQERLLAERLIEALGTQGAIVVYSNFEDVRIKALIDELPELATSLNAIRARIVDFEKIVREHVYHPAFAGSFSLKKVVPALVPDVSYDGLAVADGDNAITVFARMARGEIEDVAEARRQLLVYCKTDTFVMVRLHEVLAAMAA